MSSPVVLNTFVPPGVNLSNVTPTGTTCFFGSTNEIPGFLAPGLVDRFEVVEAILNGAVAPLFASVNCAISDYSQPDANMSSSVEGVGGDCNV